MNIGAIATQATATIFSIFDSEKQSANYIKVGTPSAYDPAPNGTIANPNQANTTKSINVILTSFNSKEVDGSAVQHGDRKGLVAGSELTGIVATIKDRIELGGEKWEVVNILSLPTAATKAVYIFHLRKTA